MNIKKIAYCFSELKRVNREMDGNLFSLLDMFFCGLKYGASPNNYKNFDFRHATSEERSTFLTHGLYMKMMRNCNDKNEIWKLENKYEFAKIMGNSYGRAFALSTTMTEEEFLEIAKAGKVIFKPTCGGQGRGISTYLTRNEEEVREAYRKINECTFPGIVESWLQQDLALNSLYDKALNPVRIDTLLERNGEVKIIGATLTLGNGGDVANASGQKSIFALVDTNDGRVITDGYDYNWIGNSQHPVSGKKIMDFQIPCWQIVKEIVVKSALKFPKIKHIGWDVGITNNGPIIIEGNNDPGYTAFQLPVLTKCHKGTRELFMSYL